MTGLAWPEAVAVGVLMNTRGLMELVILNVGLEIGVISPALFAMMVLMALATTVATSPILSLVLRAQPQLAPTQGDGRVDSSPREPEAPGQRRVPSTGSRAGFHKRGSVGWNRRVVDDRAVWERGRHP